MNTISQSCPDIGAWRAWLDQEDVTAHRSARAEGGQRSHSLASDEGPMEAHVTSCPACVRLVAELREDADAATELLATVRPAALPDGANVALARERLLRRRDNAVRPVTDERRRAQPVAAFITRLSTPWRVAGSAAAAAIALALVVAFTPEGGSVAAAFLAQFRSQQVTAVEVTPQTQADIVRALSALGNLGTVSTPSGNASAAPQAAARAAQAQSKTVTLAEAAATVKFPLLTPDPAALPAGVDKTPQVRVMPGSEVRFTFDKKKAQAYLQSTGRSDVALPDRFDGASLVVSIPSAAVLEYGTINSGSRNGLVIAQAGEVVADAQGNVTLPEMRDFLLSLPGLPPTVVTQLRQIQNWNDTLPIPIPVDVVRWQPVTINTNQGLLLNDNSGVGSAVIWHANGHLYGAAGTLKAQDLKRVAESLR